MRINKTFIIALRSLLVYINMAVLCLGIGFAPERASWSYQSDAPNNIGLWFAMHQAGYLVWLMLASVLLSVGIWIFLATICPEMQRVEEQLPLSSYPHFESPPEA